MAHSSARRLLGFGSLSLLVGVFSIAGIGQAERVCKSTIHSSDAGLTTLLTCLVVVGVPEEALTDRADDGLKWIWRYNRSGKRWAWRRRLVDKRFSVHYSGRHCGSGWGRARPFKGVMTLQGMAADTIPGVILIENGELRLQFMETSDSQVTV
jgi:hypothetical protein